MIKMPNVLIHAACISLFLMLVPGTAAPQEQKEPAAARPETAVEPSPQQQPASLLTPTESTRESQAVAPEQEKAPAPAEEPAAPAKEEVTQYTIKQGDTLWDISNTYLKDPFLWPFIWKANPSISNPDLIYAGNRLVIPNLAPIERAMRAPAEAAPKAEKAVQPEQPAVSAAVPPRPVQPAPEVPEAAAPRLIVPEEQPQPLIDKYTMLSAGFVNDVESAGAIVGSPEDEKTTFGYGDVVYVKINSSETVNVGDKFLIYKLLEKVRHPRTHERYGQLVRGLGILQITAKNPDTDVLVARITLSFDSITFRDRLTPYQEPVPLYQSSEQKDKDISGYILEVTDRRSINGQLDVVYLDKGRVDGVDPGDRFIVYSEPARRGFPKVVIGEVQVFTVKERTSTAVVRKSTDVLVRGNAVAYEK